MQAPNCDSLVQDQPTQGKTPTSSWALAIRADVLLPRKFTDVCTSRSWRKKSLLQNPTVLPLSLWKVINIKCCSHSITEGKGQQDNSDTAQPSVGLSACMRRGSEAVYTHLCTLQRKIKPSWLCWPISMSASISKVFCKGFFSFPTLREEIFQSGLLISLKSTTKIQIKCICVFVLCLCECAQEKQNGYLALLSLN